MTDAKQVPASRQRSTWILASSTVAAGTLALIWVFAVPFGPDICAAGLSGRSCFVVHRVENGLIASAVVACVYTAMMTALVSRKRRSRRFLPIGIAIQSSIAMVSWLAVAWNPAMA